MKVIELEATMRDEVRNKSALANLRKEERIPATLYGGKENINFHVNEVTFSKLLAKSEVFMVSLNFGEKQISTVVREVQYHPVTDRPIHIDFMEVFDDKAITIGVPVRFTGNSIGVMNGGQRREKLRKLVLKALPKDIPEEFVVDVTEMRIGDVIQVENVKREGIEFLDHPKAVIVSVKTSRNVVETALDDEEDDEEGDDTAVETADAATEEAPAAE